MIGRITLLKVPLTLGEEVSIKGYTWSAVMFKYDALLYDP